MSSDGVHTLNGIVYVPIGTVRATVQIIHGMCEHIELYDEFMSRLAMNGIASFMHDQLGHGHTAVSNEELGFFAEENGGEYLVRDAYNFSSELIKAYSGVKHFVFGHSMGSFIARICSERFPEMADGIILAGTSGPQPAAPLGAAMTDIKSRIQGAAHRSDSAQRLFYGMYNSEFRDEDRDYSWVSSDPAVLSEHESDELFNFTFSVRAMNDVVKLCIQCNTDEWFRNYRSDCSALIISGENDPLGNFGKGTLEVFRRLRDTAPVTFKLYSSARHELLRESCRYNVISDIIGWIDSQLE